MAYLLAKGVSHEHAETGLSRCPKVHRAVRSVKIIIPAIRAVVFPGAVSYTLC